jgi:phosphoribosylanthranilate isomerase
MKVKICGVTALEDALAAVEAGADMLGFNFYPPSVRCLTPQACREISDGMRQVLGMDIRQVQLVGVFVNASPAEIQEIMAVCSLDLAQLSGDEPPEALMSLGERAFKALRPADSQALQRDLERYPQRKIAPLWLVDAHHPGVYGGSGRKAAWDLAAGLASSAPIFLAGGLEPGNVALAVRQVRPWGVDVASGVESSPGRKDAGKMAAFIQAARQAEMEEI